MNNDVRKKKIAVVYITDNGFAMPTAISIISVINNKKENEHLVIYVFADEVSDYNLRMIRSINKADVQIDIIDIGELKVNKIQYKTTNVHVSSTAVYKFFLPQILDLEDRIIYLDGDTIIQNSLSKLYEIRMGGCYVAAVRDFLLNDSEERVKSIDVNWKRDIGVQCSDYFNSGVMLMDLKAMRDDKIAEKLINFRNKGINYFMDQDAFNIICNEKKYIIDWSYNFQTHLLEWSDAKTISKICETPYLSINDMIENATIIHCCGSHKPWKYYLPWTTEVFKKYYSLSPYSDVPMNVDSLLAIDYCQKKERARKDIYKIENKIPTNLKPKGMIVLYGAGKIGHIMNYLIRRSKYADVVLWVDENAKEVAKCMDELILPVDYIRKHSFDQIFITLFDIKLVNEIKKRLLNEYGITDEKIVILEGIE